jgi:hypothetical protein
MATKLQDPHSLCCSTSKLQDHALIVFRDAKVSVFRLSVRITPCLLFVQDEVGKPPSWSRDQEPTHGQSRSHLVGTGSRNGFRPVTQRSPNRKARNESAGRDLVDGRVHGVGADGGTRAPRWPAASAAPPLRRGRRRRRRR